MHEKFKKLAQKGFDITKSFADKGAETTKDLASRTVTQAKNLADNTANLTKNLTEKGKEQTKPLLDECSTANREIFEKSLQTTKELTNNATETVKACTDKGTQIVQELLNKTTDAAKEFTDKSILASIYFAQKSYLYTSEKYRIASRYTSVKAGTLFAFISQRELLKWTEELTKQITGGKASDYDKALDAVYNQTHIGGGYHRLFDGGHDAMNAWEKVHDALPDDTFGQEVAGYASALWKDAATKMGLPFKTMDQEFFNDWAEKVSNSVPAVNKDYLYDLLSFDAIELISIGIGATTILFCFKKQDQKKLAEILGSMGIVSIASANPLMAIFVIGIAAYSYTVKKTKLEPAALLKGGSVTAFSCAVFTFMSTHVLIELVIVIALSSALKTFVLNNDTLIEIIKTNSFKAKEKGDQLATQIYEKIKNIPTANKPSELPAE